MLYDSFILLGVFFLLFILLAVAAYIAVPKCRRCKLRLVDTGKRLCAGCEMTAEWQRRMG